MHHPVRATEGALRVVSRGQTVFSHFSLGHPKEKQKKRSGQARLLSVVLALHAGGCELGSLTFVYSYHGYFI